MMVSNCIIQQDLFSEQKKHRSLNVPNKVFVYGTLMRRQGNHSWLGKTDQDHVFMGVCDTVFPYKMVEKHGIPAVIMSGCETQISGELYYVTDRVMRHLDLLESNENVYERVQVSVKCRNSQLAEIAWLYFGVEPVWRYATSVSTGSYKKEVNVKGYIEEKNGKFRLLDKATNEPLTRWRSSRTQCYSEYGKKKKKEKKSGDRSN